MTIRDLEVFIAVAETGHIGNAAKKLYISQPTVSHVISQIENNYHVKLFERLSKKMVITPTGEEFLQYARHNLKNFRSMEHFLCHASEQLTLHIGASLTVGSFFLAPMISAFEAENPHLRVRVYIDNTRKILRQIIEGSLDIAILEGNVEAADVVTKVVYEDKMVLICAKDHPFAVRKAIRVEELQNVDCVLREEGSGTRDFLIHLTEKQGIPIVEKWVCHSSDSIINIVAANQGVSLLSEALVLNEPRVVQVPIEDTVLSRQFRLVWHKDKYLSLPLLQLSAKTETYFQNVCLDRK